MQNLLFRNFIFNSDVSSESLGNTGMAISKFKVDFFCVGVAKAGTTTLHELLCLQDDVALPARKETNYFSFGMMGKPAFTGPLDGSSVNEPTVTSFEDYENDFDKKQGCLYGEICPSYMLEGAAQNIHDHNPEAKIIILLREPVDRAYSNYQHLVRDGREHGSFEEALAAEANRLADGWEWFWGLKQNSFYFDAVRQYFELFGKENVKIIFFEEFVKAQPEHLREIMKFVGMNSEMARFEELDSNKSGVVSAKWRVLHKVLLSEGKLNSMLRGILPTAVRKRLGYLLKSFSTVKGAVSVETRAELSRGFSSDLHQLHELIGGKVSEWLGQENVSRSA